MALKWCQSLIWRQAVNEILMDMKVQMSFRKGHAAAGNQRQENAFFCLNVVLRRRKMQTFTWFKIIWILKN